jgi:tetratricopeptide (TPR) repeat protein
LRAALNPLAPVLALLLELAAPNALAQADPSGAQAQARPGKAEQAPPAAVEHYLRGRRWYLAGRYRDALNELKIALEHDPRSPDLLYNVARVYENLGEFDESIAYYQRYMEALPAGSDDERDKTGKTIRRLQGAKRELAQQTPWRTYEPQQPRPSMGRADLAFWLTGGGAIALIAGGAVTGVLALKQSDEVGAFVLGPDGGYDKRKKLTERADNLALASDLLFIGGAVALTGAALLYLLRDGEEEKPNARGAGAQLDVGFDAHGGQLRWRGSF